MENDIYSFDPAHPIPLVEAFDNISERNDGGLDLFMIITRPLEADERSLARLSQKLRNYLNFIKCRTAGDRNKTYGIAVFINASSDSRAIEHLRQSVSRAAAENIAMNITRVGHDGKISR